MLKTNTKLLRIIFVLFESTDKLERHVVNLLKNN